MNLIRLTRALGEFRVDDSLPAVRNPSLLRSLIVRVQQRVEPIRESLNRDLIGGVRSSPIWISLGWNDIRQKYRRSVLGPFWITLSMGIFILLLGLIYSRIFKMDIANYLPFLTVGYIVWGFISQTTNDSCGAFQDGETIIRQIRLPYSIYVFRVIWRNFITLLHTSVIYIPIAFLFRVSPTLSTFLVLPGLALLLINLVWISLSVAIFATRYRDITPIVATTVQIMLFITPIMWPVSALGNSAWIARINPLYHLIELMRAPMLGATPAILSWQVSFGVAIVGWLVALGLLRRASSRLVFWL